MSPERSLLGRIFGKEKAPKKAYEDEKRVVSAAFHLLKRARVDSFKGRMVVVEIPRSNHSYHIIDLSKTDRVKQEIEQGNLYPEDRKLVIYSLREQFGCYVSFPLPFEPDLSPEERNYRPIWTGGSSFDGSMMKRFARHLEKAVPSKLLDKK
jgi:hypothetical protein